MNTKRRACTRALCFAVLLGILLAGLWPVDFFFRNGVNWLENKNGLHVEGNGVILGTDSFPGGESGSATTCSLEIWLQDSNNRGASTILTFYRGQLGRTTLLQDGNSDLILIKSDPSHWRAADVDHTFSRGTRTLVTVSSGPDGTAVYFNETLAKLWDDVKLSRSDCSGRLILCTAADSWVTWNGDVLGMAVYNRYLNASKVRQDYAAWNIQGHPEAENKDRESALYLFSERSGTVVHNQITGNPDLYVPAKFYVPYKPFLTRPWREFDITWSYLKDVSINITGFIPFGFLYYAFFHWGRRRGQAIITTMLLGAFVSLAIESLQWYLPTRDSSMTDLIGNVLGTGLGIILSLLLLPARREWAPEDPTK